MTHFSAADELDSPATAAQLRAFDEACEGIAAPRSAANSAGLVAWSQAHYQCGRAGLMLFGVDPTSNEAGALRLVMTIKSRVFAVRSIAAGEAVGYAATFVAERPTRVGLVAMGYADDYPRRAPTGTSAGCPWTC
jgi:alanine racemase